MVLCSAADTITICQDKIRFHRFCSEHGLPVLPRVSHLEPFTSPLFARPRWGSASTGCQLVQTEEDWLRFKRTSIESDWIVQPFCRIPEFTIDALFDDAGRPAQWVPRERLRVVGGESKVSQVVQIDSLML
jgi:carbamoyl-phosphate synthase large subunit